MFLDCKKAVIFQTLRWRAAWRLYLIRVLSLASFGFCLVCFGFFVNGVTVAGYSNALLERLSGGVLIFFFFGLLSQEIRLFLKSAYLRNPPLKFHISDLLQSVENFNLADFLDEQALLIVWRSSAGKFERNPDGALLLFIFNSPLPEIFFIIKRAELSLDHLSQVVKNCLKEENALRSLSLEEIIFESAKIAQERRREKIGVSDILLVLSAKSSVFQEFLVQNDLKKNDLEILASSYERQLIAFEQNRKYWELPNLLKRGSVAQDWASGYTVTLDNYALDLGERFRRGGFRKIIGHEREIKECERILDKEIKNNVLIVGEPGTGRKIIIDDLAQKSFLGRTVSVLNYKRFLQLDVSALAAATSFEQTEATLDVCFSEAVRAGNVVLVIDDFHNFVGEEPKAGHFNIAGILSRYLPLSVFKLIAVTSYDGLHRIVERNSALLNQLEKVEVAEISPQETLMILQDYYVPFFERKIKRMIGYKALRDIIKMSARYLAQTAFPDKAIKLLDETVTYLNLYTKDSVLRPKHVRKVVSEKTQIPLEELEAKEKETLLNLEKLIHQRIINQEEAVKEVASALRRTRAEVKTKGGPIGTFLFLGPTGVGKTETAKALAALYFGAEQRMIRLDMNEFQNPDDVKRILGTQEEPGLLTAPIKENPFSLLLLDEIEKAHANILNLFLQLLDEGYITDGVGRKIDFQDTIIIATSNAGAEMIRQDLIENKSPSLFKENLVDQLLRDKIFRPEFINRFDAVVVFKPLSKENLLAIAQLFLQKLARNLDDKGIVLDITLPLKEKIVELSYNPAFGAREMKRVLQDKVENPLAESILSGKIKRGNHITIDPTIGSDDFLIKIVS